jgi:formylglycine-generating enzyme required for sulfatase activity
MGSPETEVDRGPNEEQVEVTLTRGFWMAQTEVTQELYVSVVGTNPAHFKGARKPVELVSWQEAVEFCRKLTERERSAGRLSAAGEYRLPTEAEWEYACRAGSVTEYYNGDGRAALAAVGWYDGNANGETHPVDEKEEAHPSGLYGMHGNVFEWCLDGWDETVYRARPDLWCAEVWPDMELVRSTPNRVLRGGSWFLTARDCRSACRNRGGPGLRRRVRAKPGPGRAAAQIRAFARTVASHRFRQRNLAVRYGACAAARAQMAIGRC